MQTFALALLAAGFASAVPQSKTPLQVEADAITRLEQSGTMDLSNVQRRQLFGGGGSTTANDLVDGQCGDVVFIFARGSTEPGNIGGTVGPALAEDLKDQFDTAVQGVDYAAGLSTNALPGGADPEGIAEMKRLWELAVSQCPDSTLVGGGYSQGAAVVHRSIEQLDDSTKSQIAGVVNFGDTQKVQSGGEIPGIADDDFLIICNPGDLVCNDTLIITAAHLAYVPRVPQASRFLADRITAARGARMLR